MAFARQDYVDFKHLKKNWYFVLACIIVIGGVLYLWLRWHPS